MLASCPDIGFPRRRSAPLRPTDASISTGSRPRAAAPDAPRWRCRARTTRRASSSRSPRRRRSSTPRAASSYATPCRWPGGWLATSPRSAPTRSCCRPTKSADPRAQARWRRLAPRSASARPWCAGGGQERGARAGTEGRRGDRGVRRRGARMRDRDGDGSRAAPRLARAFRRGRPFDRSRRGSLFGSRAAAAQHRLLRRSRRRGRDADDRARSRRGRGELRARPARPARSRRRMCCARWECVRNWRAARSV